MDNTVQVSYRAAELPEYKGNPLIEALPPIALDDQLHSMFDVCWPSTEAERRAPPHLRRKMLARLNQFSYPLPEYYDVFHAVEDAILEGYLAKNPLTPTGQHFLHYLESDDTSTQPITGAFKPTGIGLSLFGESGAGKTRGVDFILSQFPQYIDHTSYMGKALPIRQISWIKIDCPSSATSWGFIAHIRDELDRLLETDELGKKSLRSNNIEEAGVLIERALRSRFLGLLILDELQNLLVGDEKLRKQLLNVFLRLINRSGIPILFCGNDETKDLLKGMLRNARRAESGGSFDLNGIDQRVWPSFINKLWTMQYTSVVTPLEDEISSLLFNLSTGLPDFAIRIYRKAQEIVIGSGEELISLDVIQEAHQLACPLSESLLKIRRQAISEPVSETSEGVANDGPTGSDKDNIQKSDPPAIADANRVQHPEFRHTLLACRNSDYGNVSEIHSSVLRDLIDKENPLEDLEKQGILVDGLYVDDPLEVPDWVSNAN